MEAIAMTKTKPKTKPTKKAQPKKKRRAKASKAKKPGRTDTVKLIEKGKKHVLSPRKRF